MKKSYIVALAVFLVAGLSFGIVHAAQTHKKDVSKNTQSAHVQQLKDRHSQSAAKKPTEKDRSASSFDTNKKHALARANSALHRIQSEIKRASSASSAPVKGTAHISSRGATDFSALSSQITALKDKISSDTTLEALKADSDALLDIISSEYK